MDNKFFREPFNPNMAHVHEAVVVIVGVINKFIDIVKTVLLYAIKSYL